jgi:lysophospholipase L1-like esterase
MIRGSRLTVLVAGCLLLALWLPAQATGAGALTSPPLPDSMAAIGDSITQAYDDCCSFGSHPQDSWSTGNGYPANGIASHYQRIVERNASMSGHAFNYSVPGARVADTLTQAQSAVRQQAQYVTILIGANDVCTSTIGSMTPTSTFQLDFESTMSTLESGLPPGAHIFVSSIPNIFQLWSQLNTNPTAQVVWSLGHICQSMLAPSNTPSQRQQVLAQEQADNEVLASVCELYANCRWDGGATYNYMFSTADVSSLDFFHPSQTGQGKLAALTWNASWWPALSRTSTAGYWEVASDGGIFSYGDAQFFGSTASIVLNKPIVGMAATPDDKGYWLVASDGGIFSYGDATFQGSAGSIVLNKPIVGMAATLDGKGYWLVASDGGIFSYGDATFQGSAGSIVLNKPIVGMAATPDDKGYWHVASDGGIFSYGDAQFFGSTASIVLNKPIVGMAATPDGGGYWLVATDGGIFSYGDATFQGSAGSIVTNKPIVGMAATLDGKGYWLVATDGGIFSYGDAQFFGSTGSIVLNKPVVGMALGL